MPSDNSEQMFRYRRIFVNDVFNREKAEFNKIRASKNPARQPSDAPAAKESLALPIMSFIFGLLGIAVVSSNMTFVFSFAYGFVFIFLSIFLGIIAIKKIRNYREHIAYTGFAVSGILFGAIAVLGMLDNIF
jgi:hypothetical protein